MMRLQPPPPIPPAPLPPPPPGSAAPGGVRIVVPGVATPLTGADAAALRARRSELNSQIQSATTRRNQLARELRSSLPNTADRAGLEARLQLLDQRILLMERDLTETSQLLAMAPARATTVQAPRPPRRDRPPGRDIAPMAVVLTFLLLLPFAWAAARSIFRQPSRPVAVPADEESRERLARLEVAVDAIAIEMERVAEGQRFVSRLLAESAAARQVAANGEAPRRESARAPIEPGRG